MKTVICDKLYCADNLNIMRKLPDNSIDLIYMDPPFFTQRDFKDFTDKWEGIETYLEFIKVRLIECHRLLKPTGSLFVHLDWRMSHYIKIELDKIFGVKNPCSKDTFFVNEIIWHYYNIACPSKKFLAKNHDTILWYSKNKKQIFNIDKVRKPYAFNSNWVKNSKSYGDQYKPNKIGKKMTDVWDIPTINNMAKERTGWPTQKPLALLDRIIKASSNEGAVVLDPFCGSGTTCVSAHRLKRKWIGIDKNKRAISICKKRFKQENMSLF